jgi:hypothetical protein
MPASDHRFHSALPIIALLLVGLGAAGSSIGNGFAYDDFPIIVENARVHAASPFWTYLGQPYWPGYADLLYRPLTVWLFGVQWAIGGGAPWVFHATSVMLYLATAIALFTLGRRLLPLWAAWLAAALFTVHPVHVEAVANIVGQAELHLGLATIVALIVYLRGRERETMSSGTRLAMTATVLWAMLSKEQGLLVPFALVLAEATVVPRTESFTLRMKRLTPLWVLMAALVSVVLGLRWMVLGQLSGGVPATALVGASLGERALTMLGVVPEWVRLFLWPYHLQADYSPPGLARATAFGGAQALGLILMMVLGLVTWRSRNRMPVVAFGCAFMVLMLLPVTNLVAATGIVLAERTLYLPSVGLVLAIASGATLFERLPAPARMGAAVAVAALLTSGMVWSNRRQTVWQDNDHLFRQTMLDAPDNYRSYWLWARHLRTEGRIDQAVDALLLSTELYGNDPVVFEDLGQLQRERGRCGRAVEPLRRALAIDSTRTTARSRLIYCLIRIGDLPDARSAAVAGFAMGDSAYAAPLARIDSLMAETDAIR